MPSHEQRAQTLDPSTNEMLRERLNERMVSLRLSPRQVSIRAGFSPSYVSDILAGISKNPTEIRLQSVA